MEMMCEAAGGARTVNIYDVRNQTLKERYVGVTELPVERLRARSRASFPALLSHWDFDKHDIVLDEVGPALPESGASLFVEIYLKATDHPCCRLLGKGPSAGLA